MAISRSRLRRPRSIARTRIDPEVARLTREITARHAEAQRSDVIARADVGRLLASVKQRLRHGEWLAWVDREIPFTDRTATRAIALDALRRSQPAFFMRLAPLGIGKTYLLMRRSPASVNALLGKRHRLPGWAGPKSVPQMTFDELFDVVAGRSADPSDGAVFVKAYRRGVDSVVRAIDQLIEQRPPIDVEELEEIHDKLLDAESRLAAAFSFDDA